jgi:hypothetical protein
MGVISSSKTKSSSSPMPVLVSARKGHFDVRERRKDNILPQSVCVGHESCAYSRPRWHLQYVSKQQNRVHQSRRTQAEHKTYGLVCSSGATWERQPINHLYTIYVPRSSSHIAGSWIIHVWFTRVQHFDVRIDKRHKTSLALMTYLVHAGSFPLEVVPRDCGAILAA